MSNEPAESVLLDEPSQPGIEHTTACEHYYVEDIDQDPNTNLVSVRCTQCWHGVMIDPTQFIIKEGQLWQRENPPSRLDHE